MTSGLARLTKFFPLVEAIFAGNLSAPQVAAIVKTEKQTKGKKNSFVAVLFDLIHNIAVKGTIPLNPSQKKHLLKFKNLLEKLTDPKIVGATKLNLLGKNPELIISLCKIVALYNLDVFATSAAEAEEKEEGE